MPDVQFVGRGEAVDQLRAVLTGGERAGSKLTIQSIEGPGGIGKTCLLNHVIASMDLNERSYLTLSIDGNDSSGSDLARAVARMVDGAKFHLTSRKPSAGYFPHVSRVTAAIQTIRHQAIEAYEKSHADDREGKDVLARLLELACAAGKPINEVLPGSRRYFNTSEWEKAHHLVRELTPVLAGLKDEAAWLWGVVSGARALRNAIRENACRSLSDALVTDLAAILCRYQKQDRLKITHAKIKGSDRLLLILDDYEHLHVVLGEFLVGYLLPALRTADFDSVVIILGRDQLAATHPGWDQHLRPFLLKPIALDALSRAELDLLVEMHGVTDPLEKERVWRDTQGYPFYVQLWMEEMESGGRNALMLKRFHDRTTRWMTPCEKKWLQHTIFLNEVNIRSLRQMLGATEEAEEVFHWFEHEGSIRDTTGHSFRVREYLRSRLLDYLRISDPDRFDDLQAKAALI